MTRWFNWCFITKAGFGPKPNPVFGLFATFISHLCFLIYLCACGNSTCNRNNLNLHDSSLYWHTVLEKGEKAMRNDGSLTWRSGGKSCRGISLIQIIFVNLRSLIPIKQYPHHHHLTLSNYTFTLHFRPEKVWAGATCSMWRETAGRPLSLFFLCVVSTIGTRRRQTRCLCSKVFVLSFSLSRSLSIVCAIWQEWMLVTSHFLQNIQGCAPF